MPPRTNTTIFDDSSLLIVLEHFTSTCSASSAPSRRGSPVSNVWARWLRHTFISRAANYAAAIHLVRLWAGHTTLETTLKYLHNNGSYKWIEMDKMLAAEAANEKVVALDACSNAS